MGNDVRLVMYAPDQSTAEDAGAAAFKRIAELDSIMSDYRVNSELTLLCRRAGGPPVPVSKDLYIVLERSQQVSRRSGGAFDITVGPLVRLWRQARKAGVLPTPAQIAKARKAVGWRKLVLNPKRRTAHLTVPGMQLDLGGIAKGYAGDEAQAVLKRFGVTRALAQLGGDIVVTDAPPDAPGWTIRVPNAGSDQGPTDRVFTNRAVSTSGDTEQATVISGKRYSHVVDPRTGWALTNRVQVTLTAPRGLASDPLSTALGVLGGDKHRLLSTYPSVRAWVRVLPFSQPSAETR